MEQKINIAEILKYCPKGMEIDCTMWDNVVFEKLDVRSSHHPIIIRRTGSNDSYYTTAHLTKYGQYSDEKDCKCVIYPKGKTTWEGFQRPFMDGDVVVCTNENCTFTAIFKSMRDGSSFYRYGVMYDNKFRCLVNDWSDFNDSCRLATEEEKQKLFGAIKANGYKWNEETKTLEKLTPNKFDISTLKAFDKVLVRDNNSQKWTADLFSFYDRSPEYPYSCIGHYTNQCIPYEGNEHLLGTTDDCDEYFKNW